MAKAKQIKKVLKRKNRKKVVKIINKRKNNKKRQL